MKARVLKPEIKNELENKEWEKKKDIGRKQGITIVNKWKRMFISLGFKQWLYSVYLLFSLGMMIKNTGIK